MRVTSYAIKEVRHSQQYKKWDSEIPSMELINLCAGFLGRAPKVSEHAEIIKFLQLLKAEELGILSTVDIQRTQSEIKQAIKQSGSKAA